MADELERLRYHIALSYVPGIGPHRYATLVETFGSAEEAWHAPPARLRDELGERTAQRLASTRCELDVEARLDRIRDLGLIVLTAGCSEYPASLASVHNAPHLLFVRGDPEVLSGRCVAVVGARKASDYGRRAATRIAGDIAAAGLTVVSGLALGIDSAAHRAALEAGGTTIAVTGCGLDVDYPRRNSSLRSAIGERGALVSEYPPGIQPVPGNFPARNRIVSGLCLATVVVEASAKSGALITAHRAADQGRDVFAVPGPIMTSAHAGSNALLAAGAGVALSAEEVLAALDLSFLVTEAPARARVDVDPTERIVLDELGSDPIHIDDLCVRAGMDFSDVARALTLMELRGLVHNTGGMRWIALE